MGGQELIRWEHGTAPSASSEHWKKFLPNTGKSGPELCHHPKKHFGCSIRRGVEQRTKWFLISAQVFFRELKRGGKKGQSNGHLAARFDCLMRGDLPSGKLERMLLNHEIDTQEEHKG